jgi:hypothetical protein
MDATCFVANLYKGLFLLSVTEQAGVGMCLGGTQAKSWPDYQLSDGVLMALLRLPRLVLGYYFQVSSESLEHTIYNIS